MRLLFIFAPARRTHACSKQNSLPAPPPAEFLSCVPNIMRNCHWERAQRSATRWFIAATNILLLLNTHTCRYKHIERKGSSSARVCVIVRCSLFIVEVSVARSRYYVPLPRKFVPQRSDTRAWCVLALRRKSIYNDDSSGIYMRHGGISRGRGWHWPWHWSAARWEKQIAGQTRYTPIHIHTVRQIYI